jgi:hypothetical protein
MSRGKYKARAANRTDQQQSQRIADLEAELATTQEDLWKARKDSAKLEPLQRALDKARTDAEALLSPRVAALEAENAKLRAEWDDLRSSQPHRDKLVDIAVKLLMEHEGLTWFAAYERVAQMSGIDATLVEASVQKRLSEAAVKRIQKARGIR